MLESITMWKKISNEEYHGEYRNYLGSSDLRRILRSPAHFRLSTNFTSSAQEYGTMVHAFALEPDVAASRFIAGPELDRRTKAGKEAYERVELEAVSTGARVVRSSDYHSAAACAGAVRAAMDLAGHGLHRCETEVSGFLDGFHGVNVKIRPDALNEDYIFDLKTTQDCTTFEKSIFSYGYDIQASFYCDVAEKLTGQKRKFLWVAVEKEPPYGVMLFEPSAEILERGQNLYRKAIEQYKVCAEWDHWPAYDLKPRTVQAPRWMYE